MGKEITRIVLKVGIVYGLFLLFNEDVNPLVWSTSAKVWFTIVLLIVLGDD